MKERRTSLFRHGMAQSQGPGVGEERALDQALEALVEVAQVPFAQVRRVAVPPRRPQALGQTANQRPRFGLPSTSERL